MLHKCSILFRKFAQNWKAVDAGTFDVCIIGGGPAGIAAALRAVDYNKRVCIVERWRIGGADLWNGTLTSKVMWQTADTLSRIDGPRACRLYGQSIAPYVTLGEETLRKRMESVSEIREKQILTALKETNVVLLYGQATFLNDNEIQVRHAKDRIYNHLSADHFIVATGSSPREHPFVKTDGKLVVSSDHIMGCPIPKSLVVVGAGALGCEFATIYAGLKKTKVYLVDKAPHILPKEDEDVVDRVESALEQAGVVIHHNSSLYDMRPCHLTESGGEPDGDGELNGVEYTVMNRRTREFTTLRVHQALIAVSREPNYRGLGLENTTLNTTDGKLTINEYGQCVGVPHIYCIGDASGDQNYVTLGEAKGKLAVDYMFGSHKPSTLALESIAKVSFLTTTVASVGLNEKQCRARGISYLAAKVSHETVSRAVAAANTGGFVKIITTNDAKHTILGLQAVGLNAGTLVDLGSRAINSGQTAAMLADRLTAYPSVSEAFQESLRTILGSSQLKPGVVSCNELTCWVPKKCSPQGLVYPQSFTTGRSME